MSHIYQLDTNKPLVIGASGFEAICQNIRIIIMTFAWSVPLDRSFAHLAEILDSPAPRQTARLAGSLVDAIEKYEPRVKVEKLEFVYSNHKNQLMQGHMTPKVYFRIRDGVKL